MREHEVKCNPVVTIKNKQSAFPESDVFIAINLMSSHRLCKISSSSFIRKQPKTTSRLFDVKYYLRLVIICCQNVSVNTFYFCNLLRQKIVIIEKMSSCGRFMSDIQLILYENNSHYHCSIQYTNVIRPVQFDCALYSQPEY